MQLRHGSTKLAAVKITQSAVKNAHRFGCLIGLLRRRRLLHFLSGADHAVQPEITSVFCLQQLISGFRPDKGQPLQLWIPAFLLDHIMEVLCHKEQIVHDFCRIFEYDMIHLLKYIMLPSANDLIGMVYRTMSQRFYIGNLSFNLEFADNFFKL